MPIQSEAKATRRPKLTQQRVLIAALRIADKEGLDALSMRRLARTLRVEAMSLYNHFPNKDAILDGLVEHVLGQVTVPLIGTPWQQAMRQRALSARGVFLKHPWAASLSESRSSSGPMRLRLCNAVLAVLAQAGFTHELSQYAFVTLDSYIYGFTLQESSWPFRPEQRQAALEGFLANHELHSYEHVAAIAKHALVTNEAESNLYDRQFEFGLELILDGLKRARRRSSVDTGLRSSGRTPQSTSPL